MSYYYAYGHSTMASQILGNLQQMGFFDFVLPWIFAFAIVYGILVVSNIFNDNKAIYAVISMVIAFFVTNYSPYGTSLAFFFSDLFGQGIMVLAGLLVIILMLALFMGSDWRSVITKPLTLVFVLLGMNESEIKGQYIVFGLLLVALGAFVFLQASGWSFSMPSMSVDDSVIYALIIAAMLIAVVVLVAKEGKSGGGGKSGN